MSDWLAAACYTTTLCLVAVLIMTLAVGAFGYAAPLVVLAGLTAIAATALDPRTTIEGGEP